MSFVTSLVLIIHPDDAGNVDWVNAKAELRFRQVDQHAGGPKAMMGDVYAFAGTVDDDELWGALKNAGWKFPECVGLLMWTESADSADDYRFFPWSKLPEPTPECTCGSFRAELPGGDRQWYHWRACPLRAFTGARAQEDCPTPEERRGK